MSISTPRDTSIPKQPRPTAHYVDNVEFQAEMKAWKDAWNAAKAAGQPTPKLTDSMCTKILAICRRAAYNPKFLNYPYRDEMVLDGVECVIRYVHNYDADRFSNPFAYVTQLANNAYWYRRRREIRQFYTKVKLVQNIGVTDDVLSEVRTMHDANEGDGVDDGAIQTLQTYYEADLKKYEAHLAKKRKKAAKVASLDDFIEEYPEGPSELEEPDYDDLEESIDADMCG